MTTSHPRHHWQAFSKAVDAVAYAQSRSTQVEDDRCSPRRRGRETPDSPIACDRYY